MAVQPPPDSVEHPRMSSDFIHVKRSHISNISHDGNVTSQHLALIPPHIKYRNMHPFLPLPLTRTFHSTGCPSRSSNSKNRRAPRRLVSLSPTRTAHYQPTVRTKYSCHLISMSFEGHSYLTISALTSFIFNAVHPASGLISITSEQNISPIITRHTPTFISNYLFTSHSMHPTQIYCNQSKGCGMSALLCQRSARGTD